MKDNQTGDHRLASLLRIHLVAIPSVAATLFMAGYFAGLVRHELRVQDESLERFREFISTGIDLGFIVVDRGKLEEIIIAGSEGPGEDREAADKQEGDKK